MKVKTLLKEAEGTPVRGDNANGNVVKDNLMSGTTGGPKVAESERLRKC